MNTTHTTIKVAYIGTFSILNIISNAIVVAVIAKYPQLREDRTNLFMLSLMLADILYGTLAMPLSALLCSTAGQSALAAMPHLPNVHILLSRGIGAVSLHSLSWVTLCKMIAITKPFIYERHLNGTRCYMIITVIWSIGLLFGIASFRVSVSWSPHVCLPRIDSSSAAAAITDLSFLIIGMAIPIVLIVYGTTKIFMVIVRTHQEITTQVHSIGGEQITGVQSASATLQSLRSGKNVLIICASIVLIAVPTIAYDIRSSLSGHVDEVYLYSFFMMWIAPWNTVVNSVLFVFLFRNVRAKTRDMLKEFCGSAN